MRRRNRRPSVRFVQQNGIAVRPHRLHFDELTTALLHSRAEEYRDLAAEAPKVWIRDEFYRIATGLDRIAEEKKVPDQFRRPRLSKLTADQLRGLAQAYRALAAGATTEWGRNALNQFAAKLELMREMRLSGTSGAVEIE